MSSLKKNTAIASRKSRNLPDDIQAELLDKELEKSWAKRAKNNKNKSGRAPLRNADSGTSKRPSYK